jgi:hypothetical protein
MRRCMPLDDDAFYARLAALKTQPRPYLHKCIVDELIRRFRLLTDDEIEAFIRAHPTPEDYAWIQAKSDAELAAFEAELAAEGWVRPDES